MDNLKKELLIKITSTSSTLYSETPCTSIYPAFVDNMPYQAWTTHGCMEYFQLQVEGGFHHYIWSIVSGSLPDGLSLSRDGRIGGMPIREGIYEFTVKVIDNRGSSDEKSLIMEAFPFRGKWFKDAKFGLFIQWGSFTYPSITGRNEIQELEDRIVNFDADKWAEEILDMGGRVLNFTIMHNDNIRLWPSNCPTVYELKTNRDIVGELIEACHKRGIGFIAYLPGDGGYNGTYDLALTDRTCATMHYELIRELLDKGIDGIWIDSGGSIGRLDWFDWQRVVPLVRSKNPFATIQSNTAPGSRGKILNYPNVDIVTYEGLQCENDDLLTICIPNTTHKRMAIDVVNMLDFSWTWLDDSPRALKSAEGIIGNIQENWYNDATYMLNITPHTDGTFIPEAIKPTVDKIGKWVKDNLDCCETPIASLDDGIEYEAAQTIELYAEPGAVIYYTTDGSIPTLKSTRYSSFIFINESTRIKAVAVKAGRGNSRILDKSYILIPTEECSKSIIEQVGASFPTLECVGGYTGVKIVVGKDPLVVSNVGRFFTEGNCGTHSIKIVRVQDLYPVVFVDILMDGENVSEDGYVYKRIAPVTLDAYSSYYVVSEENSSEYGMNFEIADIKVQDGAVRILRQVWTDETGTIYNECHNKLIRKIANNVNFKYVLECNSMSSGNFSKGAEVFLQDNEGNIVHASSGIHVAENAIDGNPKTMAVAGQEKWAWTLHVDLGTVKSAVGKVIVTLVPGRYPTEYEIMLSVDENNWDIVDSKNNFTGNRIISEFEPTDARFVRIRAIKPDGPGQIGGQMCIGELEIYPVL